jgi:transposase-like protein
LANLKELIAGEEDFLRPLIGLVVQEVLEAEMSGMPTPNRCIWVTT